MKIWLAKVKAALLRLVPPTECGCGDEAHETVAHSGYSPERWHLRPAEKGFCWICDQPEHTYPPRNGDHS